MNLDEIHDVADYSRIALNAMIERLRRSRSEEQLVYRETELDEIWRIVDIDLRRADCSLGELVRLKALHQAIERSHDLVGVDSKPLEAARALEDFLAEREPGG